MTQHSRQQYVLMLATPGSAETNYDFPSIPGPRLTYSQKPTGTVQRQKLKAVIVCPKQNLLNNSHYSHSSN